MKLPGLHLFITPSQNLTYEQRRAIKKLCRTRAEKQLQRSDHRDEAWQAATMIFNTCMNEEDGQISAHSGAAFRSTDRPDKLCPIYIDP
jgi:hypothetical protein